MKSLIAKVYMYIILVFWIVYPVVGQKPSDLPKVIPPSPVASSFTIYGNYPVSHSTGVPDIQIPLYVFKNGDIEIPINLKYHIGSAKPNPYSMEMSNVGYGWVLDAGGLVTRTVVGIQDESGKLTKDQLNREFNQMNETDYFFLSDIARNQVDSEYDIFNYNFLSGSGNFVIEKNGSSGFDFITFPYKSYKFSVSTAINGSNTLISSVKIIDDKGYDYLFSDVESNGYLNTGWFISQIISPKNNQVNFIYSKRNLHTYRGAPKFAHTVNDYFTGHNMAGSMPGQPDISSVYLSHYTSLSCETKLIKEINSVEGKIIFAHNADSTRIQSLTVYNNAGEQLRRIVFYQSKFPGQNVYVRLDSIIFEDSGSKKVQKYIFGYNSTSVLNSENVDYWGWYNGVASNSHLPYTEFLYEFSEHWSPSRTELRNFGSNDRCVDTVKILAQTLNKVTYPTGGSTEFMFETNKYLVGKSCSNKLYGGGLRIKSITSRDENNGVITKTYEYQPGTFRFDRFNPTHYSHFSYDVSVSCGADVTSPGFLLTRSRSFAEDMNGEILDYYVKYPLVTEYFGNDQVNSGKNVYNYLFDNNHEYKSISFLYDNSVVLDRYKDWGNDLLYKVESYRREANSLYKKVKEVVYNYKFFNTDTLLNLKVFRLTAYSGNVQLTCGAPPYVMYTFLNELDVRNTIINNNYGIPSPPFFGVYNYYIHAGGFLPESTIERNFIPETSDTIVTTNYNHYEKGNRKYVTRTVLNANTPDQNSKIFTYPYDFSDENYSNMVNLNRLNYTIEVIEEKNGWKQKTKANYKNWGNNIYEPEIIQTAKNSQSYENRIVFGGYDNKGNVLEVSKEKDVKISYLWGYNQLYPIVKAENASQQQLNGLSPDIAALEASNKLEQQRLREGLPNARLYFYTYKPLVGITSETDPNGFSTYYEYDNFGRLKCIKNNNGEIVKTFEYHYKQ